MSGRVTRCCACHGGPLLPNISSPSPHSPPSSADLGRTTRDGDETSWRCLGARGGTGCSRSTPPQMRRPCGEPTSSGRCRGPSPMGTPATRRGWSCRRLPRPLDPAASRRCRLAATLIHGNSLTRRGPWALVPLARRLLKLGCADLTLNQLQLTQALPSWFASIQGGPSLEPCGSFGNPPVQQAELGCYAPRWESSSQLQGSCRLAPDSNCEVLHDWGGPQAWPPHISRLERLANSSACSYSFTL